MTSFAVAVTLATIKRALRACAPETILDIGCGDGGYSTSLRGLYKTYIGLEPSDIPQNRRMKQRPEPGAILVHNDPNKPLPLPDDSIDTAIFLASYDHIPNRKAMIDDVWRVLKPSGHLLITMTNYGFWAKRLLNAISRRQLAKAEHDHYCVHNPYTLQEEISEFSDVKLIACYADDLYVPNSRFRLLYKNRLILRALNQALRISLHRVLRLHNSGSVMTLVFEKPAVSSSNMSLP